MMPDTGTILAAGLATLGGVVWVLNLSGRVNGHDKLFEEREKQADDRHEDLTGRLTRIEDKLDMMCQNGQTPR
jgi:hypothetical protein